MVYLRKSSGTISRYGKADAKVWNNCQKVAHQACARQTLPYYDGAMFRPLSTPSTCTLRDSCDPKAKAPLWAPSVQWGIFAGAACEPRCSATTTVGARDAVRDPGWSTKSRAQWECNLLTHNMLWIHFTQNSCQAQANQAKRPPPRIR